MYLINVFIHIQKYKKGHFLHQSKIIQYLFKKKVSYTNLQKTFL